MTYFKAGFIYCPHVLVWEIYQNHWFSFLEILGVVHCILASIVFFFLIFSFPTFEFDQCGKLSFIVMWPQAIGAPQPCSDSHDSYLDNLGNQSYLDNLETQVDGFS